MPNPDPLADNPFTQVYNALWTMVSAHKDLDQIVRVGNRIDFGKEERDVWKRNVSTLDVPEIVLVQDATQIKLFNTSSTTMAIREYSWLVSTGDFRINHFLNKVEWLLMIAHLGWKTHMAALTYQGKTFVKRMDFIGATTGASDAEKNRGLQGWSSIWKVQVEMHFVTASLRGEL